MTFYWQTFVFEITKQQLLISNTGKPKIVTRVGILLKYDTMKKSLKSLKLKKEVISNFEANKFKGGSIFNTFDECVTGEPPTDLFCATGALVCG